MPAGLLSCRCAQVTRKTSPPVPTTTTRPPEQRRTLLVSSGLYANNITSEKSPKSTCTARLLTILLVTGEQIGDQHPCRRKHTNNDHYWFVQAYPLHVWPFVCVS